MGETNPMLERRKGFTRRATMLRMMEEYRARFAEAATGRIRATFQLVTVTAWAP
jgi:hypothetical protein